MFFTTFKFQNYKKDMTENEIEEMLKIENKSVRDRLMLPFDK